MSDDIVARLRVLNHHAKKLAENESLHDLHREAFTRCENLTWEAAAEIERLRGELVSKAGKLPDAQEIVRASHQLGNGTHRVFIVRASDYSRGEVAAVRIATPATLAAMLERCAADIGGEDARHVGHGTCDMSFIVTMGELEVSA